MSVGPSTTRRLTGGADADRAPRTRGAPPTGRPRSAPGATHAPTRPAPSRSASSHRAARARADTATGDVDAATTTEGDRPRTTTEPSARGAATAQSVAGSEATVSRASSAPRSTASAALRIGAGGVEARSGCRPANRGRRPRRGSHPRRLAARGSGRDERQRRRGRPISAAAAPGNSTGSTAFGMTVTRLAGIPREMMSSFNPLQIVVMASARLSAQVLEAAGETVANAPLYV